MQIRRTIKICLAVFLVSISFSVEAQTQSTRKERRAIETGNKLYKEGRYVEAAKEYQTALTENPTSAAATYNLGLADVRRGMSSQSDSLKNTFLKSASGRFSNVARLGHDRPELAAKAYYNLGNMAFDSEQYQQAIDAYKSSLRLEPNNANTRKNLRIAQLKLKDQNQDKNQDKDKNQDQQDKQDQQKQNTPPPPQEKKQKSEINESTSDQILKAMENKENEIRARVMKANNGKEAAGAASKTKKW